MAFFQYFQPLSMKLFQTRTDPFRQFSTTEMDVLHGCVNAAVPRKGGNVVQVNPSPRQIRQAQVA
jgi:hypothetical protein